MVSSRSDLSPSFFIFNIHYSIFSFLVRPFPVHTQEIKSETTPLQKRVGKLADGSFPILEMDPGLRRDDRINELLHSIYKDRKSEFRYAKFGQFYILLFWIPAFAGMTKNIVIIIPYFLSPPHPQNQSFNSLECNFQIKHC
jgi:hypothetical protein